MAVTLTGTGGLYTRWGKLAKVLYGAHQFAGGNLLSYTNDALAALGSEYALQSPLPMALAIAQQNASQIGYTLQQEMRDVLLTMVNADTPLADRTSVPLAAAELIRQMKAASASVPSCLVGASASAVSGNSGSGAVVATVLRGDGLNNMNVFAEVGDLLCTADAQGGFGPAGSEQWLYRGDYAVANPLDYSWPGFSGAAAGLTTIDSQAAGPNLLANGGFDAFAVTDVPDGWTFTVGTATTHYGKETSVVHRGAAALKVIGDGSTPTSLEQAVAGLQPDGLYAINLWLRVSSLPAAGVLSTELVDGSGAVVSDDKGNGNVNTTTLSLLGTPTTYTPVGYVFRTPRVLPATLKVRLRLSTALSAGVTLYLDSLAAGAMTQLYQGGPSLAVFAGAAPWIAGDRHLVTVTNDRNGAGYGATWQAVTDRFFPELRASGLQIPYSGSPTIADSLITS